MSGFQLDPKQQRKTLGTVVEISYMYYLLDNICIDIVLDIKYIYI